MIDVRLIRHLIGQLTRGRRLLGLFALAAVPGVVAWLVVRGDPVSQAVGTYDEVMASVTGATLSIAVLVIGAAVMRDERDGGTLPFLFLSPIPRWRFALSAWAAAGLVSTLVAVGGWAVGLVGFGFSTGEWGHPLAVLPAYVAAALAYSALFLPIGYLFNRAILVGLAYVFIWEGILTSLVSGLAASSVWRTALSITADLRLMPQGALEVLGPVAPGVWGGVSKVAAVVIVATGLFTWALRTRDAL